MVGRCLEAALDMWEYLVAGRAAHEPLPASRATYNHLLHACHQASRACVCVCVCGVM